jgi:polysaccharide pyruvyl transferase WcaK-like protein
VKVLILNSDSPHNRGDRAILQGMIALVQDVLPNAEITSLSPFAQRDAKWFGINFLPFSPYSTSPVDYLKLLGAARKADVILWGGGELLKDYTNKLSLFYWALKLWGIKKVNNKIIGAFQGIGPTSAEISKWAIRQAVDSCQFFLVRDEESKTKLTAWGVKTNVVASFDPAVYTPMARPLVENVIGLGLRRWFHYQPSGWLPNKYKFWQKAAEQSAAELRYLENMAAFADNLVEKHKVDLRFYPMHMAQSENDAGFARQVISRMKHQDRCAIVEKDDLSPSEYLNSIGSCKAFIASRLHSAILASVAGVPAICIYYVDKGRLFFEQIGLARYSMDINRIQEDAILTKLNSMTDALLAETKEVSKTQAVHIEAMKKSLFADLSAAISGLR